MLRVTGFCWAKIDQVSRSGNDTIAGIKAIQFQRVEKDTEIILWDTANPISGKENMRIPEEPTVPNMNQRQRQR